MPTLFGTIREIRLLTSLIAHFEDFLLENRASIHDILLANKTHVTKFLRNENKTDTNLLRKLFTEQIVQCYEGDNILI